MARLLVVDDDRALLRALRVGLSANGHEVAVAVSGVDGLAQAALRLPEVVVLDLGLPDLDGVEVCRRLRQWSEVPVIVLSATGLEDRKVAALDGGADDYVTKPFGMAELAARIRAALRRPHGAAEAGAAEAGEAVLTVGALELDIVHHQGALDGAALELTAREFDVLTFLARHSGKLCTHRMILEQVWGAGYGEDADSLRAYVYRLRRKLGAHSGMLRTSPGIGYSLLAD